MIEIGKIEELSFEEATAKSRVRTYPAQSGYFAMYSSWWGGIVKDPRLMSVPIDDHGFHRGDAVFEAMKAVDGKVYALRRHLERMWRSSQMIGLEIPHKIESLEALTMHTMKSSGARDAILRLYVSRGPGSFTANPYESIGAQTYLVITQLKPVTQEKYEKGASCGLSRVPVKEGFLSTVKSCNYLPNVLMKKEAVDRGLDFTISRDHEGIVAEGSTENFAIVSHDGELLVPEFRNTLRGITLIRAMELAESNLQTLGLKSVRHAKITVKDIERAREAMLLGTTLDCLSVTSREGRPVGDGRVGSVARGLLQLVRDDLRSGPLAVEI